MPPLDLLHPALPAPVRPPASAPKPSPPRLNSQNRAPRHRPPPHPPPVPVQRPDHGRGWLFKRAVNQREGLFFRSHFSEIFHRKIDRKTNSLTIPLTRTLMSLYINLIESTESLCKVLYGGALSLNDHLILISPARASDSFLRFAVRRGERVRYYDNVLPVPVCSTIHSIGSYYSYTVLNSTVHGRIPNPPTTMLE